MTDELGTFYVRIDDQFCEWEYKFQLENACIEEFAEAIETYFGVKYLSTRLSQRHADKGHTGNIAEAATEVVKPPLGLTPKYIYETTSKAKRFIDVCDAIDRYRAARLKINPEWIEEYNELCLEV